LGEWHLGYILCKLWLVFDYVVGSASTLCIVVISYDRYQMVSKGLNYISKTTIRRALKFVFGTWIIATLNYGKKTSKFLMINLNFSRSSNIIMGLVTR
jgi:histamine receptor H3